MRFTRWWRRSTAPEPAPDAAAAREPAPPVAPPALRPSLRDPIRCSAGPTMADPDRQAELERFGFTVVALLDAEQLAEVRRASEALGPAPDDPRVAVNWSFHSQSREHKDDVKRLLPLVRPELDRVFTDHEVFLTTFITKWPGPHSAFPPHQDPTLVDERRFTGVTVWAPLVDVDADNGMLQVVPGSHRFSSGLRVQDVDRSPFAGLEEVVIGELGRGVPLAAGEALVFDNRIIHYSLPNRSSEGRVVLSFGMRPRAGRCVTIDAVDGDEVGVYEVPDDFYVDVLPALRGRWEPPGEPLARVVNPVESWDAATLGALCALVGPAPRTVVARPAEGFEDALDPGVFCALCGSSEGLSEADRDGRTNAQLVCSSCQAALAAGGR